MRQNYKKIIGYAVLIIVVILFLFRHQIFDKKLSPEEQARAYENFNQMMLKGMEESEKETAEKAIEEKMWNDCIKNLIAQGKNYDFYLEYCGEQINQWDLQNIKESMSKN
jgi:hypothetical protein